MGLWVLFKGKNHSLALQPAFFKGKQIFYFKTNFLLGFSINFTSSNTFSLLKSKNTKSKERVKALAPAEPTTPSVRFPETHSTAPLHCAVPLAARPLPSTQAAFPCSGADPANQKHWSRPQPLEEQVQDKQPENQISELRQRLLIIQGYDQRPHLPPEPQTGNSAADVLQSLSVHNPPLPS